MRRSVQSFYSVGWILVWKYLYTINGVKSGVSKTNEARLRQLAIQVLQVSLNDQVRFVKISRLAIVCRPYLQYQPKVHERNCSIKTILFTWSWNFSFLTFSVAFSTSLSTLEGDAIDGVTTWRETSWEIRQQNYLDCLCFSLKSLKKLPCWKTDCAC